MQVAAFVAITAAGTSSAHDSLAHELEIGANVLNRLFQEEAGQLEQGARLIVSNSDIAASIRSGNMRAFASMVANQGIRTGADLTILTSPDGRIIGHVRSTYPVGSSFPKKQLLEQARTRGSTRGVIDVGDILYRVIIVPIASPEPAGWVVMGLRLDDDNARDLHRLTGLEVSFFFRRPATSWLPSGSTLPPETSLALMRSLNTALRPGGSAPQVLALDDVEYMTLTVPRASSDGTEVIAVLQRPIADAIAPFRGLQRHLLVIAGLVLVATFLCSVSIARRIARPVRALVLSARAVALGNGEQPSQVVQGDEIGELSLAFDQMRERIAEREKKILGIAYRDDVTLLPNRILFTDRLEQAIRLAERAKTSVSVMTMDLDRFEQINDTLGHHVGDLVLIEIARRLRKAPRRKSDSIARIGGDEFALLLPDTNAARAVVLAKRVRASLDTPVEIDGRPVDVRASIGIAVFPDDGADAITLLRRADLAMYAAKKNGNVVEFFDPSFDKSSRMQRPAAVASNETFEGDELLVQ